MSAPHRRWVGPACAVVGVLGFSFKAVLIKLAYAAHPVDAITLLTLRMLYAAPMFAAIAWWASRGSGVAPITRLDWRLLTVLGFIGYYLSSLLDFLGLQYISASLERLILFLYPTFVVLLSAWWLRTPITTRAVLALLLSYAGIALAFWHDLRITGNVAATSMGTGLVLGSAVLYAVYLVRAGGLIARLGSLRFVAFAMLVSTVFVFTHFALTRPFAALGVPSRVHGLLVLMAIFSTVLPTLLIAESVRRMGANAASLVGALGPFFTIALGALLLDETVHHLQLAGAVLVLAGVLLVTLKPRTTPPITTADG